MPRLRTSRPPVSSSWARPTEAISRPLSGAPPLPSGERGILSIAEPFPLQSGGALDGAQVAWELVGEPGLPVVAVLGGISANGHICANSADPSEGWWPGVVGPGGSLDPARYRLLGIDYLAGPGRSTGPVAGVPFPALTPSDQAAALIAVMDTLGIGRLEAIVGGSYGGMVALSFAEAFPARTARAVVLAAAHTPDPLAAAVRSIQRQIVRLGARGGLPEEGLALARALAVTTYRSREEFRERFSPEGRVVDGEVRVGADDYLDHQGARFLKKLDPARYEVLSASIDLHSVDPLRLTVPVALGAIVQDAVVSLPSMQELAALLPRGSRFTPFSSRYGHDGFLKEVAVVNRIVRRALASPST